MALRTVHVPGSINTGRNEQPSHKLVGAEKPLNLCRRHVTRSLPKTGQLQVLLFFLFSPASTYFNPVCVQNVMYPKQHAAISGIATLLFALWIGIAPEQTVVWLVIGMIAGVLIDVDHVVLGMIVDGRIDEGISWFLHPVAAVTQPDALLADMAYDTLVYHRLISHLLVLAVLAALSNTYPLLLPAVVGLAAHIVADVVWDVWNGTYQR
jgi:hypothetical protein